MRSALCPGGELNLVIKKKKACWCESKLDILLSDGDKANLFLCVIDLLKTKLYLKFRPYRAVNTPSRL